MWVRLGLYVVLLLFWAGLVNAHPLVDAARERIGITVLYDPSYVSLSYPGGDVPDDRGVCTDVIIRSLRAGYGFDLQKHIHNDMSAHFSRYGAHWGLKKPDRNIDHRRVLNIETFLTRQNARRSLDAAQSEDLERFKPGDILTWRIGGRLPHIGIVSERKTKEGRPLIIHNVGRGTQEEDVLLAWPMTGHFRFAPDPQNVTN